MSHEAVDLLQTLIRNSCVNDGTPESGHEARSVATLTEFLGRDGDIFEPSPGRQSLVYRIPGSDPEAPSLVLVPHLDVVPADPSKWSHDPFAGEIDDGFVHGRGAVDMLNVTAAMAYAVRPYVTGEIRPRGDLVVCAVADEESGGSLGAKHLVDHHWPLVGADYLLTEVAYPGISAGGVRHVPVATGEKGAFWSILGTSGSQSHGSAPYGTDNALDKLVAALSGILDTPAPVALTETWSDLIAALHLDPDLAADLGDPDRLDAAIDRIASLDPNLARYLHAATHLTVSINVLKGGTKTNVVADRARATLDIRGLPGMDRNLVDSHLRKAMGSTADQVDIVPVMDGEANLSPIRNRLWEAIADAVEDTDGHRNLVPALMTVATDARFWREKGTIAYGVGLFDDRMSFADMLSLFHGDDERVTVRSVERTAALYEKVLDHFFTAS